MELPDSKLSFLTKDVYDTFLTLMPLYQFQALYDEETAKDIPHRLTFSQLYRLKYGTNFPTIDETFETEEDEYLYCSFFFYGELGLRSHLFVELEVCLYRAIDLEDEFLFQYFLTRVKYIHLIGMLEYALQNKKFKIIPLLVNQNFATDILEPNWRQPIEVARHFRKKTNSTSLLISFANLPINELLSFDQILESQKDNEDSISSICSAINGLILSGDPVKIEMARTYLSKYIWNEVNFLDYLYLIIHLDDLSIFKRIWPHVNDYLENNKGQFTSLHPFEIFEMVIGLGAKQIGTWLLDQGLSWAVIRQSFENDLLSSIDPKKQLEVLEMVLKKYPTVEVTDIANFVLIRNSDIRALDTYKNCSYFCTISLILVNNDEDFLRRLIQRIIEDRNNLTTDFLEKLSFNYETAKKLVSLGMPQELINFSRYSHERLTYPQYMELLKWKFNSHLIEFLNLPSPSLQAKFKQRFIECDVIHIDNILNIEGHFKLHPVTENSFLTAIRYNNLDYLACKISHFQNKSLSSYETFKLTDQMKSLFVRYNFNLIIISTEGDEEGNKEEEDNEEDNE